MAVNDRLQNVLSEYRRRLAEIFGDELDSVILYGSQARGEAIDGSDIDVLCVMKRHLDYGEVLDRTSEVTAELSLKYDVALSTAFVTREDLDSRNTPFLINVRREGVRL